MIANQWTPAPWFTHREGISTVYVEARIGGGLVQEIAACGPTQEPRQQDANARLIAAAPDMMEALRVFIEWCDSEKAGPQYSSAERRDTATGEPEWRAWWENQLRLAVLSPELARAALVKAGAL